MNEETNFGGLYSEEQAGQLVLIQFPVLCAW